MQQIEIGWHGRTVFVSCPAFSVFEDVGNVPMVLLEAEEKLSTEDYEFVFVSLIAIRERCRNQEVIESNATRSISIAVIGAACFALYCFLVTA